MGDKKHIDQFFKEQFKDFEAKPPEEVWDKINRELEKENDKPKRVIPLWIQFSGIAASLIFLITVGVLQFTSEDSVNEIAVDDQVNIGNNKIESTVLANSNEAKKNISQSKEGDKYNITESENSNQVIKSRNYTTLNSSNEKNEIFSEEQVFINSVIGITNSDENYKFKITNNESMTNRGGAIERDGINVGSRINVLVDNQFNLGRNDNHNILASSKSSQPNNNVNTSIQDKSHYKNHVLNENNNLIVNRSELDIITTNDDSVEQSESMRANSSFKSQIAHALLKNNLRTDEIISDNSDATAASDESGLTDQQDKVGYELLSANTIFEIENGITVNNIEEKTSVTNNDSSSGKGDVNLDDNCTEEDEIVEELPFEKTIEEAIAEQELKKEDNLEDEAVTEVHKKWEIVPNIAPVYYNSLTSGSPIDTNFSGNTKKGQFTTSYGIGVGYALNKRWSVRTGVNRLEVGYNTEDVAVYSSPETSGGYNYKNINFSSEGAGMSIAGSGSYSSTQIPSSFSSLFDSSLNQRFGYLEVPLEVSYKLSDKKLRVDLIAGLSTFFLNKNEIYSENKTRTVYIGEANNLNKMSYSTNLGIGLEYKISKSINFNFDPMFKYQLNAFSNDAGNFKPYILGVYSGLSYRF